MIKRLLKSVREYKKPALLTPLCVTGEVIMEVIIPLLMASLIDNRIEPGSMSYILKMGILLIIACGISLIFGMLSSKYATYASSGFASNLRHDMYYHLQDYSFSNIDKFSASSLVTRLTTEVENVQMSFQMCTRMAVRCSNYDAVFIDYVLWHQCSDGFDFFRSNTRAGYWLISDYDQGISCI